MVIYGAAEVLAKGYAQTKIEENVKERYPAAREVKSSVSAPVIFGLLTQSAISRVEIAVRHVEAGVLLTDRVSVTLYDVRIDLGESIRRREAVVDRIDRLDLTVEISDDQASKTLPEAFAFEFSPEGVVITAPGIRIRGRLQIASESQLVFVPEEPQRLPPSFRPPVWELKGIPLFACLEKVEVRPGRVRVTCSIEDPPTDFPPEGADLFALSMRKLG